ncbi:MAG: reverse transcriptase family protein, partial [Candidatus Thiodiazotropha endolucinida]|nr:reverse transcriptase family protein [Candidatus Thiodiazotropha taylori]MCW4346211.1 reverse transcriptase family protein [Candidatus Thiodiazotropha endolucinida]
VVLDDGKVTRDTTSVLNKWKSEFEALLNPVVSSGHNQDNTHYTEPQEQVDDVLNVDLTIGEVSKAVHQLKTNKACGYDDIPAEVLKSDKLLNVLFALYSKCFTTGITPDIWKYGLITPIPKSSMEDLRNPTNYRGITLTSVVYKIFCNILNNRLSLWENENQILNDAQNGFRRGRSTIDHICTLTSIIETRKQKRQSTFAAFIDFRKAYDGINRNFLFSKLNKIGINGKMYKVLSSLYDGIKCCVKINGLNTDWFSVNCGLKQGCSLSPILFNFYINDLITKVSQLDVGIHIGNERVCILGYADDIVLLGESEADLQVLLDTLHAWGINNQMTINPQKSKIVHFRPNSVPETEVIFKIGETVLDVTSSYVYLGIMISEHLDYGIMAKHVSKSAGRALGLLISKYKAFGGLPFKTFSKLYESIVDSTINYGAAIWGDKRFSCIEAVQHRALRFYMGVGRYTPNAAVTGDCGWQSQEIKQWSSVINQWYRQRAMDPTRLNAKVFQWAATQSGARCKNWCYRLQTQFDKSGISNMFMHEDISNINRDHVKATIQQTLYSKLLQTWQNDLNRNSSRQGNGGNKLRTYRTFKTIFQTETYLCINLPRLHRSAYSKMRCGVAPLRIETGRYERLQLNQRTCFHCDNCIESEEHVLLSCAMYDDIREKLFDDISQYNNVSNLSEAEKLSVILSSNNRDVIKVCAKACHEILTRRRGFLYR